MNALRRNLRPVIALAPGICFVLTLGSCEGPAYESVTLSPEYWEEGELERYWALTHADPEDVPDVESSSGLVVATSTPLASRIGLEVLRVGGGAVDAVLSQAMAEIVLSGGCCMSFAGVMHLLYFEKTTGTVHWLDGGWNTVAAEQEPWTIPPQGTPSGRTAFVPGFMPAVEAAHARFGKLPLEALFEPAIYFADEGFALSATLAGMMTDRKDVLSRLPETKAVFLDEDGTFLEEGDHFRQPALARTLRSVAQQGADYLYRGEWAEKFVDLVRSEGGKMSLEDLARYQAQWRTPFEVTYGDHKVYTPDSDLLRLLYLADAAQVGSFGHFSRSAEALDRMVRVYSTNWLGNLPDSVVQDEFPGSQFGRGAPLPGQEEARALWERIRSRDWPLTAGAGPEVQHSASIIATDADGNVAVLMHTINTVYWGTTGIFVDGVSVSDIGGIWGPYWNLLGIEPGDRLSQSGSPIVIATKNGIAALASGAINHTLLVTFQAVTNVLDHGMSAGEAARMPYFFGPAGSMTEASPWSFFKTIGLIGDGFSPEVVEGMRGRGFQILEIPPFDRSSPNVQAALSWIGATFDPTQGVYRTGVTPDCCGSWAIGH